MGSHLKNFRSSHPEVFYKKLFLKMSQDSQENICAKVSFLIKLQTLAQLFSCEFCEIFKNGIVYRTPLVSASKISVPVKLLLNPLLTGVSFLYPLKTSENRISSHVFDGYKKGASGSNWLTHFKPMLSILNDDE